MNLYTIRIGKNTKLGQLNEITSFVCKTDNANLAEVQQHWERQYHRLDVRVENVVDIVESTMISKNSQNAYLEKRADILEKEVFDLKSKLSPKPTSYFIADFQTRTAGISATNLIDEIIEGEEYLRVAKKELKALVEGFIEKKYKDMFQWARSSKGFSDDYKTYNYEALLKGELVERYEKD